MKIKSLALCIVPALLVSGCAINQKVTPANLKPTEVICVVDNAAVRDTFHQAVVSSVERRGYTVRSLAADASTEGCPSVMKYVANWNWDLAYYMSFAQISVFKNNELAGDAVYSSKGGGANLSKFIDASEKVDELVGELLK